MRLSLSIVGIALLATVLWDAFESVVLPRRVSGRFRLTRLFYRSTWIPWSAMARRMHSLRRREKYLGAYGPLSLLMLLSLWAVGLVIGFAVLLWSLGSPVAAPEKLPDFVTDLYLSGTTLFTIGLGDVTPRSTPARFLLAVEGGTGLGFLALVIGYLPVIYQAFSRREVSIVLLDARAGSPPTAGELLLRYARNNALHELGRILQDWERSAADMLESHLSYPVLCFYRSQHNNQSWLGALTAILDTCALVMVGIDGAPVHQAQLTFAMARHALVDLSHVFNTPPHSPRDRLPPEDLLRLRETLSGVGLQLSAGSAADQKLSKLRQLYEPYIHSLAEYFVVVVPGWGGKAGAADNWRVSAWERPSTAHL